MISISSSLSLGLIVSRPFHYVPYGESAPAGKLSLSCDGKVTGTALDLTHWTNNETPEDLYADTSTGIALNMARARIERGEYSEYDDALVVNNHYDSDGVLSVFACTNPTSALAMAPLLIAGAEAGDFGEWSTDNGVKLDSALCNLCTADDDEGYAGALRALPALLDDLEATGGAAHEQLWADGWAAAVASWEALQSGKAELTRASGSRIGVLVQPPVLHDMPRVQSAALHRQLAALGMCGRAEGTKACTRVLRVEADPRERRWRYEYEKPGHGWVARLVERQPVPSADGAELAGRLSEQLGGSWVKGGNGGLVSICKTAGWVETPPEEVVAALVEADEGAMKGL